MSPRPEWGRGLGKRRVRVLFGGLLFWKGRNPGGKRQETARKERRLEENLGPLIPLPQTKIKTRILKGDLITQSHGREKG